jgi:hypothetical protein
MVDCSGAPCGRDPRKTESFRFVALVEDRADELWEEVGGVIRHVWREKKAGVARSLTSDANFM